jgi:hypothetical protein
MEYTSTYEDRLPEGMRIYPARFTSAMVAVCDWCDFISAYWENKYELFHDCQEHGGTNHG